jgi:hypothetical protein
MYDLDGVVAGRDDLRPWEVDELGPLDGLDVVHLQCHIGTDTVALARRGARVVGLDFSTPDAVFTHTTSWERLHSISDLLSAVIDAGLQVELFHEFDATPSPTEWLERGDDGLYRFPDGMWRFPVSFSLRARA